MLLFVFLMFIIKLTCRLSFIFVTLFKTNTCSMAAVLSPVLKWILWLLHLVSQHNRHCLVAQCGDGIFFFLSFFFVFGWVFHFSSWLLICRASLYICMDPTCDQQQYSTDPHPLPLTWSITTKFLLLQALFQEKYSTLGTAQWTAFLMIMTRINIKDEEP